MTVRVRQTFCYCVNSENINVFKKPTTTPHPREHKGFLIDWEESLHLLVSGPEDLPTLAGRSWMDGSTGACVLTRYVQLTTQFPGRDTARHWLELLNKANFSCQRMCNLRRAEEITNSLVNILP